MIGDGKSQSQSKAKTGPTARNKTTRHWGTAVWLTTGFTPQMRCSVVMKVLGSKGEKSGSLCGIISLTKVIFGHHHIHWLMADFLPPLTWEWGFYYCFSWITKWYISLFLSFQKHHRNIYCLCVCALASLAMKSCLISHPAGLTYTVVQNRRGGM